MVETVSVLLGICLLVFLLTLYIRARSLTAQMGRSRPSRSEHLSADDRAEALLREIVSEEHYRQLLKLGYLEVASPSIAHRRYRIPAGGGLVKVYEHGRKVVELCLQPAEPLPESDVMLLHKLMIEANEQEYLRVANHFVPGAIFQWG
jgi:hypothetical protein